MKSDNFELFICIFFKHFINPIFIKLAFLMKIRLKLLTPIPLAAHLAIELLTY